MVFSHIVAWSVLVSVVLPGAASSFAGDNVARVPLASVPAAPSACAGCDLQSFVTAGLPVAVAVTFGPLSFPGSCTGESGSCTGQPCWLQTLEYSVTNPPGAPPVRMTVYSGSFPTLTGTELVLGTGSNIVIGVGKATDDETKLVCGSSKYLVTVETESAGVKCTACL